MGDKLRTAAQLSIAVGILALATQAAFAQNWWFFAGFALVRCAWWAIDAMPRWGANMMRAVEAAERRHRDR